jgi:hypothetical protein
MSSQDTRTPSDMRDYSEIDIRAYVTEQFSTIAGKPVTPTDTLVAQCWTLLSRQEEYAAPRDAHGNFVLEESVLGRLGMLEAPPLNADVLALAGAPAVACWPHPYRFAACLTHDVDEVVAHPWRERLRRVGDRRIPASLVQRGRWALGAVAHFCRQPGRRSETAPFDGWMAEEARHGFHSTFFVMPEMYAHPTPYDHYHCYADPVSHLGTRMTYAESARHTRLAGWEIGLHGSYASAHDGALLRAEKAGLEAMLGAPVESGRQHYLRFAIEVTPHAWAQAGIRADATMGCICSIGYRTGLAFPYFWPGDGDILEVPLSLHDISLFRLQKSRQRADQLGAYADPAAQLARAQALIKRVAAMGGVVTLSWHTHPDYPHAMAHYRALLQTVADLGGWGCTLGELNTWWRARREMVRRQRPAREQSTDQEVNHAA